jgi:site-specific DNA recombinase
MGTVNKAVAVLLANNQNDYQQYESFVSQYETIEKYANNNNIKIVAVYDNAASNADLLTEALEHCKKNPAIKYVLVSSINRISRDINKYRAFKALCATSGVKIISATENIDDTPMGTIMENVYLMMGQRDRTHRSEMITRSMARRAEMGYSVQRPPLGYMKTTTRGLYQKENTACALACYFNDTLAGKMSVADLRKAISKIYYRKGLLRNNRFKKLVSNPYYSGFVSHRGNLYQGLHEPILTPEQQQQLVGILGK